MMKKSPQKVLLTILIVFVSLIAIPLCMRIPFMLSQRKAQREAEALEALNRELELTFKQSLLEEKNVSGFSPRGGKAVSYNLDENRFSTFSVPVERRMKTISEIDEVGFIIKFERGPDEDEDPDHYYRYRESGRSFDKVYATWRVSVLETAHFAVIGDLHLRSRFTHRTDAPEEEVNRRSIGDVNPIEEVIAAYLNGEGKE
jgi:hypothetical protein